jgi:molybdopterin/thiamine biosynthesis adenylyltransferase/rhodanese-related sulfurtransferase
MIEIDMAERDPQVLTLSERQRYSRHLLLPEVGEEGQRRLKSARVLCVGAGGLGSPAALYLAAAGVGTLGFVDFDVVDFSNLQRQIIHGTGDVGRSKLESARSRIEELNPEVNVELFDAHFSVTNAKALVEAFDVIVDGTDNFPARYLVNDACVMFGKPNAWGSIFRFEGQASVFAAPGGPCYRCLHPEPPPAGLVPSCAEAGVLGVLPGVIGTIQATEALKLILGIGDSLVGRFLVYDALKMRFRDLKLPKDPDCPVCGLRPTITELREHAPHCETEKGDRSLFLEMSVTDLKRRIDAGRAPVILDVREPSEVAICCIFGSLRIPLGELPQRLGELDAAAEIVVHCKSGARSARAVSLLQEKGFTRTSNLTGGISQWIKEIDGSLTRY